MNTLDALDAQSLRADIPEFRAGDTLKVHARVVEGNRSRIQIFNGVVIRRQGAGVSETFTVRKVSFGVGVERTYPVHSPAIDRIEVVSRGDVRRAKLYYLRERRGKKAKIKELASSRRPERLPAGSGPAGDIRRDGCLPPVPVSLRRWHPANPTVVVSTATIDIRRSTLPGGATSTGPPGLAPVALPAPVRSRRPVYGAWCRRLTRRRRGLPSAPTRRGMAPRP